MPLLLPKELLQRRNEHGDLIRAHFGSVATDFAAIPSDVRFVFICFTNRCGSHFLADALASSGVLNYGGEMYNAEIVIGDSKAYRLRDLGQFVGHLARTASSNGIFVSKATVMQLAVLAQAGVLDHILGRTSFLLLERDDKLGQAISYALALGTGKWTSAHRSQLAPEDVPFAPEIVKGFIDGVATEMGLFYRLFALNGIVPLHVSYERLEAAPEAEIARIGAWLGVPGLEFRQSALRLRRQTDKTNMVWRERFLQLQQMQLR